MLNDNCCKGCTSRKLGCRTDCVDWAAHEALKLIRYAETEAAALETQDKEDSTRRHMKTMNWMKRNANR